MANIQVDDILAGTPAVQCKTKVRERGVFTDPDRRFRPFPRFPPRALLHFASDAPRLPERPLGAQIVCTLGPKSADLSTMEELLRAGMSVARFNFSHGSHEYHQGTLNTLRQAMLNTRLMCAVLLDTKGPEIRTGMLKGGKPVLMEAGREITIHTDYTLQGDEHNIAMSYKKLPMDVAPGAEVRLLAKRRVPSSLFPGSRLNRY